MERTGLSDLLSNETTGQGDFPGNGLARLLEDPAKPKAQDATAPPAGGAAAGASVSMPPSASVADFVKNAMPAAQRVAKRLNVPVEAVIGQWGLETGWGKSVIPGTNNLGNIKDFRGGGVSAKDNANGKVGKYRQYASVDEFADDFANLLANSNYKAVPGTKDAQSYFAALKAARYAEDPDYVAKGASAAKMVADAIGKGAGAQAGAPDLAKAPKWGDITSKAEFKALSDAEKAEAKKAYFDYWIAPQAGDQADSLREQFMAKSDTPGLGQRLSEGLDGLNERAASAIKGMFKSEPALLERPNADVPKNEAASMAPVRPEVRAKFNTAWDSATPQQREAMAAQPGWVGMLARERAGIYGQPGEQLTKTGQQFDPRVESRREALIAGGEDARAAATFARLGAARGIQPGLETAKLGTIEASEFDFDTKQAFGGDQANGLNNVLARGLTKGGLGFGKAITGYGEFLSDVYGLDETGKTMREGNKWARGKEEAIGQRGDRGERNLEGAISSIAQQLPLLIGGIKAGSEAIPLAGMAMQVFGQEYTDGRAMGQSIEQAATRAAVFAAFEVIGEKFGLKANMSGVKALAAGKPADEVMRLFASAMAKDVPGELLTTTGQFGTDKFAPGGVGLNPQGTLEQYASAMVDTFIQTLMQGGIMGGAGYIRPTWNALKGGQQLSGQIEAGAITARDRALGAWETNGLSASAQPGAQATPRAEPTMTPHQTVQDADQIVRELAEQAGVPLETVLPQSVVAPVTVAPAPAPAETPAQAQGQDEITDADVMAFAESRYRALRDKAEGGVSLVPGDEGMVEQQTPGVALSEVEQRELDALDQMGNDPAAVRTLYGFDGQRTEVAATPAPEIASAPAEVDADIPGFGDVQSNGIAPNWDDLDAQATTEESSAVEIDAPAQDAGTATEGAGVSQPTQEQPKPRTEKEARAQKAEKSGWEAYRGGAEVDVYTTEAIRSDAKNSIDNGYGIYITSDTGTADHYAGKSGGKRNALKISAPRNSLLSRDAKLSEQSPFVIESLKQLGLYQGNESITGADLYNKLARENAKPTKGISLARGSNVGGMKAANALLEAGGIRGMSYQADHIGGKGNREHYVIFNGKDISNATQKGTPNGTQATQAQQAGAQQQEAGDQGSDAQAGAGAQGPGVPATGRTDVQADGLKGAAPGARMNGEAERAAADRLEKLIEQIPPNALPRAAGAKMILRSVVEQLRKPRTATSVEAMLETASERLYADKYVMQAEAVIDVLDAIDQRNGQQDELDAEMRGYEDKASGKSEQEPTGLVVIPADAQAFAGMLADEIEAAEGDERLEALFTPGMPKAVLPRPVEGGRAPKGMPFVPTTEAAAEVEAWKAEAKRQGKDTRNGNADRTVISLFDASGVMAQPWIDAGYNVVTYDLQTGQDINDFTAEMLIDEHGNDKVWAVIAQPPCTDFASSGAQWWKEKDADGRTQASNELVRQALRTVELLRPGIWVLENPVGRIAEQNNLPDPLLSFDPWHFGDPWTKRTLYWGRFNNQLPTAPVAPTEGSKVHKLSGSNKYERSLTPEGVAYALFMANNAAGMTPSQRMAYEFPGVERALFADALDAGKSESDVRTEIEDAYHDGDLETVRETLEGLADGKQEAQATPAAADDFDAMFDDVLAEELAKDEAKKPPKPKTEKEAKAKRAEAAVREMTEEGRAKDGKPINGGDVFRTLSGRTTTPYPKQKGERYASDWLVENAKAEAQARGDDFNTTGFGAVTKLKGGNLTDADRDSALMYLFGQQPAVVPSILKPLASAAGNTASALGNAIDGLGALFGGGGKLSSGFTFDEDTYAKAKPLFKAAVANMGDAGKDLREAMRAVIRMVLDKFGAQAAQNMKPYAVRFVEEISTGEKVATPPAVPQNETDTQEDQANEQPTEPQPVPEGSGTESQSDVAPGDSDSESLDDGLAGNGDGSDLAGGVPAGTNQAGARGKKGAGRGDGDAPGAARDRAGKRAESGAAESDDHVIDADDIGKGGLTKKFADNIAAITVLKAMEAEGRVATPAERKILAKYAGWGALKGPFDAENKAWAKQHAQLKELLTDAEFRAARASTLDAHYTSPVAVGAMYAALERIGFKGGRLLEPSVGIGNFFGLMPTAMRNASNLHGVELDSLTSRMVAALYPKAKIAKATAFEDFDVPAEFFDVVIGNPPFGNTPITDAARSQYSGFTVHNYFLAKAIDKLRPGGVMAVVVTHNFLDAADGRARKWIGQRANLVGAVRLPNTAFKENAGTSVVTDILIFQKKGEGETTDIAPWQDVVGQQNTNPKTGEVVEHKVNQLFVGRPDLVLGKPSAAGTMHSANEYTVEMDGDIKEGLDAWVKTLTADQYQNIDRSSDKAIVAMSVPDGVKVGSFYVDASGKVMRRGEDVMGNKTAIPWDAKSETALARMKGMVAIREALRTQMRLERSVDATEQDIEANRATLNKLYDDFLKKFKHLNSITNRSIFLDDTEAHLVQALEFDYDRGIGDAAAAKDGIEAREPSAKKADIFLRRVAFPPQDFMTVTTAKDALLASLNYRGSVDAAYMQEVYGKSLDKIIEELGDVVYQDPQAGLVIADEYLSGDVKTKLAEAKEAAKSNPAMGRNVAALEQVIPKDKKPSEIAVSLGASFVPASVYEEFAKHITGTGMKAGYLKATGQWLLAFETGADLALNRGKYGTSDLSAQNLMELTMMGRGAVVKQTIKNPDGSSTTIVLEKETEAAREKQNAIKQEWQKWIWDQPARAESLVSIYNDTMNRLVARKFDGAHMTFPGKNPTINLLEHQKNGVWRGLQSGQILYDHVVGAGKTFQMVALAMEMRRLGIARKPLFVVPNHLTLQWRSEFTRLYPGSNVLAATPEDFSKDKRERMFAKIVTGDWDAVIIGHSSLKKIGLPVETEKAVLQEQIDEIAEAIEAMKRQRGDRRIVGDMERIRKTLDAKMKEKLAAIGKRSKVLTFDELGIDAMAVDEMHEFKNLTYNSTMDRNPGMGNPAGSGKAFDMFVKVRWLFDTFGEKVPFVTATGTPVSNSLVEMYNIQRYMQYPTLKASGLHVFDAWAKQFGSVESVYEVAPSGSGYRQSTRFAKFTNLPALMGLYNSFADTITLDDLKAQEEAQGKKFPVPRVQGGRPTLIVAKRSPAVAALMGVPKAQLDEQGRVKFGVDLDGEVTFEAAEEGKFKLRVGNNDLGIFATKEDATLKLVELAMSPVVSVEPGSILGRFANLRTLTKETKGKVNALSLTGEANKAGLDYRLIDPGAADFPGSKINLAVGKMMEIYKQWTADKGAQLVFCDMSIPLSARASYANKARRLYVRDESSALAMKRGTMHAAAGHEQLPFFVVQRGTGKDDKRFDVYDAASGVLIAQDLKDRAGAIDAATAILSNEDNRAAWIAKREVAGEISPEAIDEYNNDNDVEVEDAGAFFLRDDIAGMSGSAKFSVYDDIKAKLMAKGVPEREIAFIHDYASPTAKAKLFKAVKDGDVRFLLGSTPKMGAGTNVQDRLVGLHHIDAPWRPSDLEQREGRIIRRDNKLYMRDPEGFEVFIGRYATEQTYDTRRWQILEHKARGIEQLRNYDGTANEIEDIDGEAATSADMKAAASGDPLILEETKHRTDVKRLERLQAAHQDEIVSMNWRANDAQRFADERGPAQVALIKQQIETAAKHQPDAEGFSPIHVEGSNPSKDKDAAHKALQSAYERVRNHMTDRVGVEYRGMSFAFEAYLGDVILRTPTGQGGRWDARDLFSPSGMVQRLKNYVDRLPALADDVKAEIEKQAKAAEDMRKQAEQPFAQAGDLQNAREAHKRVQRALMAKGPAVPDNQKGLVRDAMDQQIERLRELGIDEQILSEFMGSDKAMKFSATDSAEGYTGQDEKAQVHPQKTERSARNIRQLQRGVVAYLRDNGQTVDDRVQPYVGVDVRAAQEIRAISQVFGIEVQWFALAEGLTPEQKRQFGGFDGANLGGVQYLNAKKGDRPHLAVLGHELAHQMRKDSPELYAEFVDSVNRYIKPGEYKKFLNLAVARDAKDPREEFSGEVLSDLFMERDFWISLGERSPGLLAKVADMVTRLVEQLMQAVGYTKRSAPYVSDFNKVMEIAADVMTRYAGQKMKAAGEGEISFSRTDDKDSAPNIVRRVQNNMIQFFGNSQKDAGLNTFNAYDKTVGSQYNKALKDKHFGRVYQLLLGMQNHVSMAAMRAAQLAPGIMPAVDDIKGAAKALFSKRKQGSLDNATRAIFLGTLAGETVMDGKVWAKAEFMGRFNDETAWALYQQARAAIDASLDEVASAEAYNMASKFLAKDMRAQVIAQPGGAEGLILGQLEKQLAMTRLAIVQSEVTGDEQQANEMAAARDSIKATIRQVERIFVTAKNLKLAGYAPLMRFGKYTVEAKAIDPMTGNVERDENGKQITHFFGRYESEKEARKVEAALRNEYEGDDAVAITAGTYNSDRHELYTGVTPETLELFAEATGMGDMADEFIRLAKSDRSAMKRQLERKGTPGFSQDLPRVMSSFITSNARHAAQRLYMTSINQAVKRIPKEKGDVQQEAQKLRNFVLNPDDAGAVSSSLMFAWFLGGSVAAAAVNMTQPLMVTLPFLTQFTTVAKASALLTKAMPAAFGKAEITDKELREGLERASLEGVVDAQEIFHLYSMGSNQLVKGNRGQAALTLWGAMFSGVEKINRRMTFIAAWNLAKERGEKNPYAFAVRAVNQTQGIYNKVNRPNIARTWGGRMVMTYKGYSLMVGELMVRMWKSGPQGKKAVMIMLAMLFLAAGEEGLPMSKALDDLIDTIGQLLGFDTNMRRWKRRTAHEIMGKEWGDAFLYGGSAWLPLDFGGRLGLGQMLPGTEILKPSSGIFNMRAIGELVGPTAGAGGQIGDAAEASFEGNYGKAVQNASPKAVRDVLAGLEMATRGQATDARGRKVEDVGLTEAGVKAIGFQPTKVAMAHRRTMPIQQDIALQGKREAAIVAKWARAAMDGDQKGVEAAIAERDAWNERNPDTPIVISKQQIVGRVKTMRAEKDTRMFKTAPKEMRGRVGLDLLDE